MPIYRLSVNKIPKNRNKKDTHSAPSGVENADWNNLEGECKTIEGSHIKNDQSNCRQYFRKILRERQKHGASNFEYYAEC